MRYGVYVRDCFAFLNVGIDISLGGAVRFVRNKASVRKNERPQGAREELAVLVKEVLYNLPAACEGH